MANFLKKATQGMLWSTIDNTAILGIRFVIGIILARLLVPADFGLIGMISVIITFLNPLINSGFNVALIRKKNCTQEDYSTVFYFNITVSVFLYVILFISAPYIAGFYNNHSLTPIVKVLGLTLIIDSLAIVQRTILTKNVNFKLQAKISIVSGIISGVIGVYLAYKGFGIWSLVFYTIINQLLTAILLWIFNRWTPSIIFSITSFKEFFSFGSKLLIASILNNIQTNIVYLVIGKYYNPAQLGFYTRAQQFYKLPTHLVMSTIGRVTLPLLSDINDNDNRLKELSEKIITSIMFLSVPLILIMAALAEPMVLLLIGEKWKASVIYLQLMCLSGIWFPIHAVNLNILQIKGKSNLYLKLSVIKQVINILIVLTAIIWDIKTMLIIGVFNSIFLTYVNSYFNKELINYSYLSQMKSISGILLISITSSLSIFLIYILFLKNINSLILVLLLMLLGGIIIYVLLSVLFLPKKVKDFKNIFNNFKSYILNK